MVNNNYFISPTFLDNQFNRNYLQISNLFHYYRIILIQILSYIHKQKKLDPHKKD